MINKEIEALAFKLDMEHVTLLCAVDPDQRPADEVASDGGPPLSLLRSMAGADLPTQRRVMAALRQIVRERGGDLDVFEVAEAYDAALRCFVFDVDDDDEEPAPGALLDAASIAVADLPAGALAA